MMQMDLFAAAPVIKRPARPDTAMLLAMDADYVRAAMVQDFCAFVKEMREPCSPMPEKLLSWKLAHSCHFHAGRSAFYAGQQRTLPSYFTTAKGKNPADWFAGYDFGAGE